jgi:pimeloyl-ACP methyl ester carboxylesterase
LSEGGATADSGCVRRGLLFGGFLLAPSLVFLGSAVAPSAQGVPVVAQTPCPAGSVAGVVGGKHKCLKTGQLCERKLDRQYHRYGFHCHTGRLTRPRKPKPSDAFSRKIDVGGYRLAISCRGTGAPTVILESGFGNPGSVDRPGSAWSLLRPRLAKTTRVCSYDRAGLGASEARRPPGPVPAAKVVEELHSLLAGADISPPYVLGGWSLGGFFARLYTKRYPSEVLGLVSLDGTPVGLPPGLPDPDLIEGGGESFYMAAADAELAASPNLGARPLVVLTRGRGIGPADLEALWLKLQKQVARLSTSSILVRADTSGHAIQYENPDLTAEAFRQVLDSARAGASLPACAATPLPRLRGTCLDPNSLKGAKTQISR